MPLFGDGINGIKNSVFTAICAVALFHGSSGSSLSTTYKWWLGAESANFPAIAKPICLILLGNQAKSP